MYKNLGAKPLLFPMPVLIIATYDENGNANAMNAAWGGMAGANKIAICLSKHKSTDNILLKKAFTVSMADSEHVVACDYVGMVSANKEPDKMKKAGFTTRKSEFVDAPIINELPLALECKLAEVTEDGLYIGEIVNVCVDDRIIGDDDQISLDKFKPILFDPVNHGYHEFGARVGNAFSDGRKLM